MALAKGKRAHIQIQVAIMLTYTIYLHTSYSVWEKYNLKENSTSVNKASCYNNNAKISVA